jgi:hypothetical protein
MFPQESIDVLNTAFCNDLFPDVYYDANTRYIESTISRVSSWTASNLFSLKLSKTGFLFIGLSQNSLNNLILSVSFISLLKLL